ncbi:hypothetical protein EIP86_002675 [Pleurotus ostreatoroseus]|nr:hypothetical protein EIP86_002675 [Pleurotus ostreatoroseus]
MTTVPGELHYSSHAHHDKKDLTHSHRRGPQIPDFRFEYSYLRSVRPYVHVERLEPTRSPAADEKGENVTSSDREAAVLREIIDINWGRLLWITTRDQLLSPFAQGAVWCVSLQRAVHGVRVAAVLPICVQGRSVTPLEVALVWSGAARPRVVGAWWHIRPKAQNRGSWSELVAELGVQRNDAKHAPRYYRPESEPGIVVCCWLA